MSFFEPPPPPPKPPRIRRSEWVGPPENVVPGSFPLELVLARTDDVALFVHGGRAYPNGWLSTFGLRTREPLDHRVDPFMGWRHGDGQEDFLRIGIQLGDGRKATIFDRRPPPDDEPPEAMLVPQGGGGGGCAWDFAFWAWPLPPDGPVELVVEWPRHGIPVVRTPIESEPIRAAAARAQELWPDAPPSSQGRWTRYA